MIGKPYVKNYDAIYAVVTVDPTSKFKVIQYNTKLSTPSNTRYTILEGSELKTTSTSKTITLNASGGSDGISGGIAYSYTWKPNSQNITDNLGGTYNQWWKACPVDPSLGNSFTIKPSMIVKATSGTSSTIKTYVKLTYQKLKSPTLGTYKSDTDKTLTLKYKNHKEV